MRNPEVSLILTRPWCFLRWIKHRTSLNCLVDDLLFLPVCNPLDMIDWMRFFLLIEVTSRTHAFINDISLESGCLGIEVALITLIIARFHSSLVVISSWTWSLHFLNTLYPSKPIRCGSKTRRYRFTPFQMRIVVPRSWIPFRLFSAESSSFPACYPFIFETRLRFVCKRARILVYQLNFFHLVILVFPESKVVDWNWRYSWLHIHLMMLGQNIQRLALIQSILSEIILSRSRFFLKYGSEPSCLWLEHGRDLLFRLDLDIHIIESKHTLTLFKDILWVVLLFLGQRSIKFLGWAKRGYSIRTRVRKRLNVLTWVA